MSVSAAAASRSSAAASSAWDSRTFSSTFPTGCWMTFSRAAQQKMQDSDFFGKILLKP